MAKRTDTLKSVTSQLEDHGIEFGERLRDPASGFEGVVKAMHFYEHGCLRVSLRGVNNTTGEPAEFSFDAPEPEKITEVVGGTTSAPVPPSDRTGGPHGLTPPARR